MTAEGVTARSGLLDVLDEARPSVRRFLNVWSGGGFESLSWDDWRSRACDAAAGARALGIERGTRVGCVLTNAPSVCVGVVAVWLAGGVVASLPTPARGMAGEDYMLQLRRIFAQLDSDVLLIEESYAAALAGDALPGVRVATFESLAGSGSIEPEAPDPHDPIFVQYSSGSTREPRGCLLEARAVEAQLDLLAEGLSLDGERESGVMWLPLSHDMGLFGCLMLSFAKGMPLVVGTPERFLRSPGTWLSDCVEWQATITAAPNFALELVARAAATSTPGGFPMRKCVIGGERVEPDTLARVVAALGERGLDRSALLPAYGLAEAVLAVTMTPLEAEPRVVAADSAALLDGRLELRDHDEPDAEGVTRLVSTGRPLRGVGVRVDGGEVGEICVRSPALASGYVGDPAATAERFVDGEVRTRDLGFLHEGELYVHGRIDDMIVFAGRNVWARDVEAAICADAAVRPGSCALIDVPDGLRQRLVVVAEPAKGATDFDEIARVARTAAYRAAGVPVDECIVVPPGTVPKTPSGKIQRFRCRALTRSEVVKPLARVAR